MAYIKVTEQKIGCHYMFKVFVSVGKSITMAKAGDLVFNEDEAVDVRAKLQTFANAYEVIENDY